MKEKRVHENQKLKSTMKLIINGGSAKSLAFEAISAAKQGNFDVAHRKLKNADEQLLKAHKEQTKMLSDASEQEAVTLLMVHGQDHLMNAITFRDIAGEFVDLYEVLLNHD